MIAQELAEYLEDEGLGTVGVDIFVGYQPDTPDNCIVLYDESAPTLSESQAQTVDLLGVQVLIRNTVYATAGGKAFTIHKNIIGFGGDSFIEGGSVVTDLYVVNSPVSIGRDSQNRNEWSSHYSMRVQSTGDKYRS
jgi:hypothetical protein